MRDRARRAAESEEKGEASLEQLRSYQARRIAAERVEDREVRLQQLRTNQEQSSKRTHGNSANHALPFFRSLTLCEISRVSSKFSATKLGQRSTSNPYIPEMLIGIVGISPAFTSPCPTS